MDLNKMLSELADEIDITESQEGAIIRAYNSVADWLNQNGTAIAKHKIQRKMFPTIIFKTLNNSTLKILMQAR